MNHQVFLICSPSGTRFVGTEELRYYDDVEPELTKAGNVRANCPNCNGAVSTFETADRQKGFGYIRNDDHSPIYKLLRCAGCGRGALAKITRGPMAGDSDYLSEFFPTSVELADIPDNVPESVKKELREAEKCMGIKANRAASALLRSCLEKALKDTGYNKEFESIKNKIDKAAKDKIITESRRQRAHEHVRELGIDVLHEEWREVTLKEVEDAKHYITLILIDLYDDRARVMSMVTKESPLNKT